MESPSSDDLRMILESRQVAPDPGRAARTNAGSVESYERLLEASRTDPDGFWESAAGELEWIRKWDRVREGGFPHFRYFVGGISNPTINMLDRHLARGLDNRLALIWEGEEGVQRSFTYRMLAVEVNRFSNVLRGLGVRKGDPVAIFTPNLPETVIAVLACYRIGALFNTVFSGFSVRALRDRLESYGPKVIVTADGALRRGRVSDLKSTVDAAIEGLSGISAVIVIRRTGNSVPMCPGRDHWWHALTASASIHCEPEPLEANEPGIVFYTSGTTGKPKGIVHSGNAFIINNHVYTKYHMDHHPSDVLWCTADIGWLTMHIWGIAGALTNGVTTIFFDGALDFPHPGRFYEIVDRYRVNKIFTAPTAIRMLMRHGEPLMAPYDLTCLDVVSVVGEPFNPEAWRWTHDTLGRGHIAVNNTWGQTELAGCPLAGAAWLTAMKPGSCGKEFFGARLDVVDDEGRTVPPNVRGNLVIREPFPMMMRTLWKEPDRYIQEYFSQVPGSYFTHDAAVRDTDGHFWVLGRIDDVINVAGHRLSTMEMESAVMECAGVAEAAVVGVPDAIKGLVPVVFVTLRAGATPSPDFESLIQQHVSTSISKIAVPSRVFVTEAFPKTPSGKILRRLLKELVVDGAIRSDVTGLEDPSVIDRIRRVIESAG